MTDNAWNFEVRGTHDRDTLTHEFDRKLRIAQRVLGLAKPFCDRLAIVGSLRRGAPEPGDVDILAVIKTDGVAPRHPMTPHLIGVIAELDPTVSQPHDHHIRFHLDGVKVDIIPVEDSRWGMAMLQYTGSRAFNALVQARATALGYTVRELDVGKREGGGYSRMFISHTNGKTEDAILQVLGLSRYADPTYRSSPIVSPTERALGDAAGQMRAQQFYAERFLGRLLAGPSTEEGA